MRHFSLLRLKLLELRFFIFGYFIVVLIASVVSASALPMFAPGSKAHEAKFVAASACAALTGHVVATLVLFDGAFALGARLGVLDDPASVLAVFLLLLLPHDDLLTNGRIVRLLLAVEAPVLATQTADDYFGLLGHFSRVDALPLRTPLYVGL